MNPPLIHMHNITKRFGQVLANNQVDFSLQDAEIHAIVGENGAGKSTLMKILYGLYQPDEGEIFFRDQLVHIDSPRIAIQLGIGMVQQHFTLIPALTALENIVLAKEPRKFKFFLDYAKASDEIGVLVEQLGFDLELNAKVESLPIGTQQYAEILKALYHGAEILILDEPTADRHRHGINLDERVDENLIIGRHNRAPFCRYGLLQRKAIRAFANTVIEKYEIRVGGIDLPIRTLSGGNQQKIVVARELEGNPDLIIAAQPTRGLDINAARFVHHQLIEARNRFKGVLLISVDLEELLRLSDRIAVMYNGRIVDVVRPSETDEAELGALMLGVAHVSRLA